MIFWALKQYIQLIMLSSVNPTLKIQSLAQFMKQTKDHCVLKAHQQTFNLTKCILCIDVTWFCNFGDFNLRTNLGKIHLRAEP